MFKEKRFVFQQEDLGASQVDTPLEVNKQQAQQAKPKNPKVNTNQLPAQNPVVQQNQPAQQIPQTQQSVQQPVQNPAQNPIQAQNQPEQAPVARDNVPTRPSAEELYRGLADKAIAGGLNPDRIKEGFDAYDSGVFTDNQLQKWLNKFVKPDEAAESVVNEAMVEGGDGGNVDLPEAIDPIAELAQIGVDAKDANSKLKEDLETAAKFEQDELTRIAERKYNAELKILDDALAMQQELANRQMALVGEAASIQKAEATKMYESNKRAIELQRVKVQQAYESMQEEQRLLNKQREVRQKTANGLIYGGFGSIAANRNIEDTIMQGERELSKLKQGAVNADTEIQNEIIDLNQTYEIDLRKISQWQAEQETEIYGELQAYVQEIMNDRQMAEVDRADAISKATINYNNKYAEIQATAVQAEYDLSLEMFDRTQNIKDKMAAEKRLEEDRNLAIEDRLIEQRERERQINFEDLNLMIENYAGKSWSELPADVVAQMDSLAENLNMPDSFAENAFNIYQEAQITKEPPEFEFFTDNNGNVTAVTYDLDANEWKSVGLGKIDESEKGQWKSVKDGDGNVVLYNDQTGVKVGGTSFGGGSSGTIEDALNIPDGVDGGQCGEFVNDYTGLGLGDEYQSKLDRMDPNIKDPMPGDVFVMPYSWTGHTGFIIDNLGNGKVLVKDSNWSLDEKVKTHEIDISTITGLWRPSNNSKKNDEKKVKDEVDDSSDEYISWADL